MKSQIKQCQNCKQKFTIEPEDFIFYQKMKVPAPTFCPDCRRQRRISFFNLINLYIRTCDLCKKEKVSMYAPEIPYKIYCPHCWWSDNWDPLEYGRDYDFTRPFFKQFNELWHEVPLLGLSIDPPTTLSSPHTNHAGHLKNCYLIFHADNTEDSAYGIANFQNRSVFDCSLIRGSDFCYDCIHAYKDNHGVGLDHTNESLDCVFLKDSKNCQNCFASTNLRNKKYYIFNKAYTKKEYFKKIGKWDLGSYKTYQEIKKLAEKHWKKFPPKPCWDEFSTDITGNYVFESKNCKQCYEVTGAKDCKYLFMMGNPPIRDCYDISSWGGNQALSYECCVVGDNVSNVKFCQEAGLILHNVEYCKLSFSGSDHFGCVSVGKGKYCILNKLYAKSEYLSLVKRIKKQMDDLPYIDKKGRVYTYGEFFPIELSPFAYNETLAQKFFPLTSDEAVKQGYAWRKSKERHHKITIPYNKLPDHIKDVSEDILKQVIGCQSCQRGFRIIKMEFDFLRKMNLPLPRECPFCRINKKFDQWVKNLRMIKRTCSECNTAFETSYAEQDFKNILCKKCYLQATV